MPRPLLGIVLRDGTIQFRGRFPDCQFFLRRLGMRPMALTTGRLGSWTGGGYAGAIREWNRDDGEWVAYAWRSRQQERKKA